MLTIICPGWTSHIGTPKELGEKDGPDDYTTGICAECYAGMMAAGPLAKGNLLERKVPIDRKRVSRFEGMRPDSR